MQDLSRADVEFETRLYRFLHQINILTDTINRLQRKGDDLSVRMEAKLEGPLQIEAKTPHLRSVTELAVVMEPLVRDSSDINYRHVLEACQKLKPSVELDSLIADATRTANHIKSGAMKLSINGEERTPAWIYERFMDRIVNAANDEAREYERGLDQDPYLRDLLKFQFYDFCMRMGQFLLALGDELKKRRLLPAGAPRDFHCILCCSDGKKTKFTKAEHTVPEALGNTHSILPRGYYCDACQDLLAPVEQKVVASGPFAVTRIFFTKHTKSGAFPSAKLGAVHYTKTKPNHVQVEFFSGQKGLQTKDEGKGVVSFSLEGVSKFNHIDLARVLVKAALGGMALEKGRPYVLEPRFDAAREFARTGKGLHSRLLMGRKAKPTPNLALQWWDLPSGGAGVHMVIHGAEFLFAMTPVPDENPPPREILEVVEVFELWNTAPTPHYKRGPARSRPGG